MIFSPFFLLKIRYLIIVIFIFGNHDALALRATHAWKVYDHAKLQNYVDFDIFLNAYREHLRVANKPIMSIIDYSQPSDARRFLIIDIEKRALLHRTFVAHGINSGTLYATEFSNTINSRQTSLGTYRVGEVYYGKYGISLRLDGMSPSNSNARRRAIVLHGASYAEPNVINEIGMLGRSWGCPAISPEITSEVVELLKEGGSIYAHAHNHRNG